MQKKLIALAVAGACAAPVAFAATSNVDIYGKIHASVNVWNDEPSGTNNVGISSNASRIGFKGSEDLGGGLSAIWQVESTVNLDEGGGWGSGRNTFIGLSGKSWGKALIGKHDTPLKGVGRAVDLFGDTQADSRNVMGGGSDTRADNVAAWVSPNWGGFTLFAAYSTDFTASNSPGKCAPVGATTGTAAPGATHTHAHSYTSVSCTGTVSGTLSDKEDNDVWNVSGQYKNGPFYLGAAYGDGDGHESAGLGGHWRVAGAFTMGDFKVVAQYDNLEADGSSKGDYDAWMVGGQYKMGAITLKANYMDGDFDNAADPQQWTIGADYAFSKRTSVYALYADGEDMTMGSGGGSSDRVSGDDISVISLGVVHTF